MAELTFEKEKLDGLYNSLIELTFISAAYFYGELIKPPFRSPNYEISQKAFEDHQKIHIAARNILYFLEEKSNLAYLNTHEEIEQRIQELTFKIQNGNYTYFSEHLQIMYDSEIKKLDEFLTKIVEINWLKMTLHKIPAIIIEKKNIGKEFNIIYNLVREILNDNIEKMYNLLLVIEEAIEINKRIRELLGEKYYSEKKEWSEEN